MELSDIEKLKLEKFILEQEQEIKNMERQINHKTLTKLEKGLVKNTKKALCCLRFSIPMLVSGTITASLFSMVNSIGAPFIMDNVKKGKEIKTIIDSNNNIRYEEKYNSYNANNKIKYYGKWEQVGENKYVRSIKVYETFQPLDTVEDIENVNTFDFLEEIFETRENLSSEEINALPYIEGEFYSEDENDYIIVKESTLQNLESTIVWLLCNTLILMPYALFNIDRLKEKMSEIDECYGKMDFEKLEKKLEIKKDNYNRLVK